jgi:hypothetical protein
MATVALGFLGGVFGGILSWLATAFVARPLMDFMKARDEAARVLARFRDADSYDPIYGDEFPHAIAAARAQALMECGSKLGGFDLSNQFISRMLHKFGFFPNHAGDGLMLLSQMKPKGNPNDEVRNQIFVALRLGRRHGRQRW